MIRIFARNLNRFQMNLERNETYLNYTECYKLAKLFIIIILFFIHSMSNSEMNVKKKKKLYKLYTTLYKHVTRQIK